MQWELDQREAVVEGLEEEVVVVAVNQAEAKLFWPFEPEECSQGCMLH